MGVSGYKKWRKWSPAAAQASSWCHTIYPFDQLLLPAATFSSLSLTHTHTLVLASAFIPLLCVAVCCCCYCEDSPTAIRRPLSSLSLSSATRIFSRKCLLCLLAAFYFSCFLFFSPRVGTVMLESFASLLKRNHSFSDLIIDNLKIVVLKSNDEKLRNVATHYVLL